MARQSPRLTAQRDARLQTYIASATLAATTRKSDAAPARPSKRQKIASASTLAATTAQLPREIDYRKIRGKRGVLKNIIEMPLDILMEILGQLHPVDLLHISRANKELRGIVTDTNAKFLWKKAYANVSDLGPPLCPPGMNVLHYTNLVYGRNCHFCSSVRGIVVHYSARARLCIDCAPLQLIRISGNYRRQPDLASGMCVTSYLQKRQGFNSGVYILKEEYERHKRNLDLCENEEAKSVYKRTCVDQKELTYEFSNRLMAWDRNRKTRGHVVFEEIRKRRYAAILSKLTALGYGEEIAKRRYRLERLPGVSLTKELTDKSWENIKHKLAAVYELQRQDDNKRKMISVFMQRIRNYLIPKINNFTTSLPKPSITAPYSDIVRSDPFCNLLKAYGPDVDEQAIEAEIQSLEPYIAHVSRDWRIRADGFLLKLMIPEAPHTAIASKEVDRKPLELATTFFKCHWCAEALAYPRVLMHSCVRQRFIPDNDDDEENQDKETPDHDNEDSESNPGDEETDELEDDKINESDAEQTYGIPKATPENVWAKMSSWYGSIWNEGDDQITVDEEATNSAKAIVEACGEDPTTLTSAAMEDLDVRIECTRCSVAPSKKGRSRLVMTWKMAILHDIEYHYEETPTAGGWWLVKDQGDLSVIKEAEEKARKRSRSFNGRCNHCSIYLSTSVIESHLSEKHSIFEDDEKTLKKHFYMDLDLPMKMFPYPVKI